MNSNSYSINVFKQYLNFSASHFLIFDNGKREPLHGHNYSVNLKLHSLILNKDMVFNFLDIKPLLKRVCDSLDHRLLLPSENPFLKISEDKFGSININNTDNYQLKIYNDFFSIPKKDVLLLPIQNSSVELLAHYLLHRVRQEILNEFNLSFKEMEMEVEETPGQSASYKLTN
ncbi:MAG: 6-carboxytetrahydropterin synthase [Oligoflexia bacterium]|nr:6-carboxytetrahydropterin synthase [Oligoflexia bacterium]